MIDVRKFVHHVRKMREVQIAYFKYRNKYALMDARRLETLVDKELEELKALDVQEPKQLSMFGEG